MVYAKGIININASVFLNKDDFYVLNFSYEVKENYDDQTGTSDSWNIYSYFIPVAQVSLSLVSNQTDELNELFEISWDKNQLSFANGDYFNIDGNSLLDVGAVYSTVLSAISA